jgi:hypothetical protein
MIEIKLQSVLQASSVSRASIAVPEAILVGAILPQTRYEKV